MNDFNFMIGFDYNSCGLLHHMSEEEQLIFYRRMHQAFDGTNLDAGVNGAWFDEFGPEYCTNCDNCGEKFFLLERNGDIYSCVRGQKNEDFTTVISTVTRWTPFENRCTQDLPKP